MPVYEYQCRACGHQFEEWQKIKDDPIKTCPSCGKDEVERLISQTAFQLKGGGWYKDLYSSSSKSDKSDKSASNGKSESKTDSGSASKSESKSETKTESKSESKSSTGSSASTGSSGSSGGGGATSK